MTRLAVGLALVLMLLSALHVYWAAGGTWGKGVTIPVRQGRPALRPGPLGTMAAAFLLRGIGDFRLVGLFRRADDTRFARWDHRVYTPLALALGLGTALLAASPA